MSSSTSFPSQSLVSRVWCLLKEFPSASKAAYNLYRIVLCHEWVKRSDQSMPAVLSALRYSNRWPTDVHSRSLSSLLSNSGRSNRSPLHQWSYQIAATETILRNAKQCCMCHVTCQVLRMSFADQNLFCRDDASLLKHEECLTDLGSSLQMLSWTMLCGLWVQLIFWQIPCTLFVWLAGGVDFQKKHCVEVVKSTSLVLARCKDVNPFPTINGHFSDKKHLERQKWFLPGVTVANTSARALSITAKTSTMFDSCFWDCEWCFHNVTNKPCLLRTFSEIQSDFVLQNRSMTNIWLVTTRRMVQQGHQCCPKIQDWTKWVQSDTLSDSLVTLFSCPCPLGWMMVLCWHQKFLHQSVIHVQTIEHVRPFADMHSDALGTHWGHDAHLEKWWTQFDVTLEFVLSWQGHNCTLNKHFF